MLIAQEFNARANVELTKAQVIIFDDEINVLDRRKQILEQLAVAIGRAESRRDPEQKLATLETSATRLIELNAQLDQIGITPSLLKAIDEADRQLASLASQLAAAAPQLLIEVAPKGEGHVHLGDKPVGARHSGAVLAPARITVADLATIEVTPKSTSQKVMKPTGASLKMRSMERCKRPKWPHQQRPQRQWPRGAIWKRNARACSPS